MAGRFAKFTPKKREAYLEALRQGNSRTTSARNSGVSFRLIQYYRKETAGWAEEEEAAEMEAQGKVEDALFQAAIGGNVTACQVWLYNRCPDRWRDRRNVNLGVQPSGVDGDTPARVILELPDNGRGDAHPSLRNGRAGKS